MQPNVEKVCMVDAVELHLQLYKKFGMMVSNGLIISFYSFKNRSELFLVEKCCFSRFSFEIFY